jgi:hypothetical protein
MKVLQRVWADIRKGENIDVYIALVVSVVVAVWGLFSGGLQEKIFAAMLMVLSIMSVGLLINRRSNDKIKEILERRQSEFNMSSIKDVVRANNESLIRSLGGVSVATYTTPYEYARYKADRLRRATRVDDVTWRLHGYDMQTRSQSELDALHEVDDVTKEIIKKTDVTWREVVVFRTRAHFEQELQLIQDAANIGYNLGFYPVPTDAKTPPRVGFMIVDNEELFIGYAANSKWLAIKHPDIVAVFSAYFYDIWREAEKIRVGIQVDNKKIEAAKTLFG